MFLVSDGADNGAILRRRLRVSRSGTLKSGQRGALQLRDMDARLTQAPAEGMTASWQPQHVLGRHKGDRGFVRPCQAAGTGWGRSAPQGSEGTRATGGCVFLSQPTKG